MFEYRYLGDKLTDPKYKGRLFNAVRNSRGKCIQGKNRNMLVDFDNGERCVIVGRCIRKNKQTGK